MTLKITKQEMVNDIQQVLIITSQYTAKNSEFYAFVKKLIKKYRME